MFKVGDKVVCVDAEASGESLVLGKTYVLADVQEEYVSLEGCEKSYYWMDSRFKLESEIMDNTTPTELDPLVEIRQSEYDELIEEINLLQELLAEANQKLAKLEPTEFKPVVQYTMEDWEQAVYNKWMFEQRNGNIVTVNALDDAEETTYPVDTDNAWLTIRGREYLNVQSAFDIVRRIK